MKRNLVILGAFFILFTSFRFGGDKKQVNFIDNDWQTAKASSKSEDKPIFAFIYTSHCLLSSKMNDEIFSREEVINELNNKFICVMLDADALQNNIRITAWGANGTPTYVFLDKNRKLTVKQSGFKDSKEFILMAEDALKKY